MNIVKFANLNEHRFSWAHYMYIFGMNSEFRLTMNGLIEWLRKYDIYRTIERLLQFHWTIEMETFHVF